MAEHKPLSREFLLQRGYCCDYGCVNCPYKDMSYLRAVPYYAVHKEGLIAGFFGLYSFLSNFYIIDGPNAVGVTLGEMAFPSVEHAYQAAKWPENQRTRFLDISSAQSKRLGSNAPNFNQKKWNKHKDSLMENLVYQKFSKNIKMREMLILTDGYKLEERNNWGDTYWGTNENGEGENRLGKILMATREKLLLQKENNLF